MFVNKTTGLFEIFDKYARKGERQENLITGILIWCIVRKNNLLYKIIEKATHPAKIENPDLSNSDLKYELQHTIWAGDRNILADAKISANNNCTLLIENKIVPKDERLLGQVKDYHINANDNKDSWVLLITPDKKEYIDEEIFKKLDEKHLAKTLWIRWEDVRDICKNIIENDYDKVILTELTEALKEQLPHIGTIQYSVSVQQEVLEDDGWITNETFIVDRTDDIEDVKRVLRGNVDEIIKTAIKESEEERDEKRRRKEEKKNIPKEVDEEEEESKESASENVDEE